MKRLLNDVCFPVWVVELIADCISSVLAGSQAKRLSNGVLWFGLWNVSPAVIVVALVGGTPQRSFLGGGGAQAVDNHTVFKRGYPAICD